MNLPEGLAREIRRVTELRCFYEKVGEESPRLIVEPAMILMDRALDTACEAFGSGDIIKMMAAHQELKGFEK